MEYRIVSRLDKIEKRLDEIAAVLEELKAGGKKINDHVDFVEGVYERVEAPFNFAMRLIKRNMPGRIQDEVESKAIQDH